MAAPLVLSQQNAITYTQQEKRSPSTVDERAVDQLMLKSANKLFYVDNGILVICVPACIGVVCLFR